MKTQRITLVAKIMLCLITAVVLMTSCQKETTTPAREETTFTSMRSDTVKVCVSDTYMFLAPMESKVFRSEGGNPLKYGIEYHVHKWDGKYWVIFQEGTTQAVTVIN